MVENNKTILLVEDELLIALSQKMVLEEAGYQVIIENSGENAIKNCQQNCEIDLILMDINLGDKMDGTEVAQKILQNHDIPLIFLSSHTEREIIAKTEGITSYGYVVKESGETVLLASIKMAFRLFESKKKELEKERALRENEIKTSAIFNAMNDAIFLHPFQEQGFANFIEVNETACKKYGYSRDELLNLKPSDLTTSVMSIDHRNITGRVEPRVLSFETMLVTKDGSLVPVVINSKIIPLDGQPMILSVVHDIQERKQTENKMLEMKQDYESVFNGMIDTAWIIDFDGSILDVNKPASDLLGYTKDEILEIGLARIDAQINIEDIRILTQKMQNDLFQMFETAHRKKNGEIIPVEVFSSLITHQGKKAILSVARDITQRKWAEEEIKKQLSENEYLLKAIHHRVKNNIATIKSLLSLHMRTIANEEALSIIQDTISRVDCMQVFYETLLRSNNYEQVSVKIFSESIIDSILQIFPKNSLLKINRDIDDFTIGQKFIFPLGVIMEELLTNILKYAFREKSNGVIDFSLKKYGNTAKLIVHDNGFGLPMDFDLENTSGFGLMIVKMLAKQIHGDFHIESDNGTVSSLTFGF